MTFRSIHDLAAVVNAMKPGQCLAIDELDMAEIRWNDLHYGGGQDGFERALRGNVIGSSFGTVEVRWPNGPSPAVQILKHREGERTHDRDGYPVRRRA